MKRRLVVYVIGCDAPACDVASTEFDKIDGTTFAEVRESANEHGWRVDTRGRARCPKHNPDKLRKVP